MKDDTMLKDDLLLEYYEKGWEIGLLKLCDEERLRRSIFKFRILSTNDLIQITEKRPYYILDVACGVATNSILLTVSK